MQKLKQKRIKLGITQDSLSKILGISTSVLYEWELGQLKLTHIKFDKWQEALNTAPISLIYREKVLEEIIKPAEENNISLLKLSKEAGICVICYRRSIIDPERR